MKKTVKINISGIIFHLDEDAYEKLKAYLDKIHRVFEKQTGGSEIIKDIELRIAELFQLKLSESKQVITLYDVTEIIDKLGEPEEISEEEEQAESQQTEKVNAKRLYRDPDNAILGGVASGMGAYFSIDPVWIRLIFILLLLGYGVIGVIYIILWLILPKAETYEQKLEMRGENITISNIEKKVKKEYSEVKDNLNNFQRSEQYRTVSKGMNEIFTFIGKIFIFLFKFALIMAGIGLIIAGIVLSLSFLGITITDHPVDLFHHFEWDSFPFILFFNTIFDPLTVAVFTATTFFIAIIPAFLIIYLLFRLVGAKGNDKAVFITSIALWVISLVALTGLSFIQFNNFSVSASKQQTEKLEYDKEKVFNIELSEKQQPEYYIDEFHFDSDETSLYGFDDERNIYLAPRIDIEKSASGDFKLLIKRTSRGKSLSNAGRNAQKIVYNWEVEETGIELDSYYLIPDYEKFRMQQVFITVHIPEGSYIRLSEEIEDYLDYIPNGEDFRHYDMGGKIWKMGEDELILYRDEIKN